MQAGTGSELDEMEIYVSVTQLLPRSMLNPWQDGKVIRL